MIWHFSIVAQLSPKLQLRVYCCVFFRMVRELNDKPALLSPALQGKHHGKEPQGTIMKFPAVSDTNFKIAAAATWRQKEVSACKAEQVMMRNFSKLVQYHKDYLLYTKYWKPGLFCNLKVLTLSQGELSINMFIINTVQ